MALNWINIEEFSFRHLLLLERFQIRLLCSWFQAPEQRLHLGTALKYNSSVAWYFSHRCPEAAQWIEDTAAAAPEAPAETVRLCEIAVMRCIEDFILYTVPEQMDSHSNYIYGWDPSRLYELADFSGKTVLDVGSGSGRLALAAAKAAHEVYACEPVSTLREYLRDKIKRESIRNIRVVDGMIECLPYPDNTFDIVMAGHVIGDDYDREIAELTRVVKNNGWILDCPGEEDRKRSVDAEVLRRGFEALHYVSKFGGDVYRYRKQIFKP